MIRFIVILAIAVACSSDENPARSRRDQCLRARDHLVELRLGKSADDREKLRVALRDALGDGFVAACESEADPDRIDCILAAKDQDTAAKCN
jgi:hypothetical protein